MAKTCYTIAPPMAIFLAVTYTGSDERRGGGAFNIIAMRMGRFDRRHSLIMAQTSDAFAADYC